jgi:uncharacterized phiE125 gp8 family phage protein
VKSLVLVTAPVLEPVTLAEAQAFLNVDSSDDETLIETLISTAREIVETYTARALITQAWKLVQPRWPDGCYIGDVYAEAIALDRSPLAAVQSIKYYPASGAAQATLSAAAYHVLTGPTPGLVVLLTTESWPALYDRPDAVEVNFTAGVATAALVPKPLRHATLLLLAHLYENRAPVNIGNIVNEIPFTIKHLLDCQRVGGMIA